MNCDPSPDTACDGPDPFGCGVDQQCYCDTDPDAENRIRATFACLPACLSAGCPR